MPTYYRFPNPNRGEFARKTGGIVKALTHYSKLLPEFGWDEVDTESEADLVVGHLGVQTERLDIFHLHGLYPTGSLDLPRHFWHANGGIVENIRRARHVVVVSDWVAQTLRRDMHMRPWVVGHGFDFEEWDRVPKGVFDQRPFALWNKTRNEGVCDPTPVVELAKRFPDFSFVTTFLPRGTTTALPNVRVTGLLDRERAWEITKDATVYLATTKETFGVGVLEAMASGCAVVGFDWGATPRVLDDCGILVEPNDWDALAQAFREALDRREELGSKARARVRTHYRWHDVVERLARYYESTLREIRAPKSPRVTVVIPVHNYENYVAHAIRSVLAQSYQSWELVVVDDGSTDDSLRVATETTRLDDRARVIHQENRGVASARNFGISQACGEYICCLDADDAVDPKFLDTLVPGLDDQSLGIVYSGITLMNPENELRPNVHSWPHPFQPGHRGNQVPTCCLFRQSWWERLGGYRQRYAPRGAGQEDADFWFRILANGGGAKMVTREGSFHYRIHDRQTTRVHRGDWNKDHYLDWHPFVRDKQHPLASQLDVPPMDSWPARDYDRPDVSVVVPVGPGHEGYLVDSLDSIEAQSHRNWELVVVNDTGEPLDLTPWPYARLVNTPGKKGAGYARNRGIENTRAPLFVCLDADDFLQPGFLAETLEVWRANPGLWVYTDLYILHPGGKLEPYHTPDWSVKKLWRSGLARVTCLYSKESWEKVGGFDEKSTREDWDFHLRLARAGICGRHVSEFLFTYRQASGNRRNEGSRRREILRLHETYEREELEMACSGCSKSNNPRTVAQPAPPPGWEDKGSAGYITLEYVGKNKNDLTFRGPSGRVYRFGNNDFNRVKQVHPSDMRHLLSFRCFRESAPAAKPVLVSQPTLPPASRPTPAPVEPVREPEPPSELQELSPGETPLEESFDIDADQYDFEDKFDIGTMTVRAIRECDFKGLDLAQLVRDEQAGKNRRTVIGVLSTKLRRRNTREKLSAQS